MRREWLDEVFTGRAKVEEVGKWGIWYVPMNQADVAILMSSLRSDVDLKSKTDQISCPAVIKKATDPRIRRPSTPPLPDAPQLAKVMPTSTPSAIRSPPPHPEPNIYTLKTITNQNHSPDLCMRASSSQRCSSSSPYLGTPPPSACTSTSISKPEHNLLNKNFASTSLHFVPPDHSLHSSSSPFGLTEIINGLFTPPPSASPPPKMKSPDYIMIPRSLSTRYSSKYHTGPEIVSSGYTGPPSPAYAASSSPRYDQTPLPTDYGHSDQSFTDSDTGKLEVTVSLNVDEPLSPASTIVSVSKQKTGSTHERSASPDTSNLVTCSRPASHPPITNRQVSFEGLKRPRPRSPVGDAEIERQPAKRRSLQGMRERSRSISDSPMTPCPSSDDDDEEEEQDMDIDEEDMESCSEEEDEEQDERESVRLGNSSPCRSISYDSDSGSEPCEPESESFFVMAWASKMESAQMESERKIDLFTFDLQALLIECDIADELVEIMEVHLGR